MTITKTEAAITGVIPGKADHHHPGLTNVAIRSGHAWATDSYSAIRTELEDKEQPDGLYPGWLIDEKARTAKRLKQDTIDLAGIASIDDTYPEMDKILTEKLATEPTATIKIDVARLAELCKTLAKMEGGFLPHFTLELRGGGDPLVLRNKRTTAIIMPIRS